MFWWIILFAIVALLAYIRLAPSDPARWHVDVPFDADKTMAGGVAKVIDGDAATMAKLVDHAKEQGASVLAGSVETGHVTLIVRSKAIGFPDYITLQQRDDQIAIWSRLRFGKSDLGVNGKRLSAWLNAVQ